MVALKGAPPIEARIHTIGNISHSLYRTIGAHDIIKFPELLAHPDNRSYLVTSTIGT